MKKRIFKRTRGPNIKISANFKRRLPKFRYCSNPIKAGLFIKVPGFKICKCCKKPTRYVYNGDFMDKRTSFTLCPWCIASGKVARKFNGDFIDANGFRYISQERREILAKRTPCYEDGYYDI